MRTAAHPFLFVGCVELRQTLDMHALDERELMHRVPELPPRRGGARARGDDARGVPRRPRGRRRDRDLSARGRGAGAGWSPCGGLRRVAPGRARAAGARRAIRADRPVPDDPRAGPRAAPEARRPGAGGGAGVSRIDDYRQVAPPGAVDVIQKLAERVRGRRFLNLTGGRLGGGVAEILRTAVPILSDLGGDTSGGSTGGDQAYYATARTLQATLEGAERVLSDEGLAHWVEMNRVNAKKLALDADLVLVHDVQPASLVAHRTDGRWVWRCHFDCSSARPAAWSFFRQFADQYDAAVFSLPGFEGRLGIPMYVVEPSIDPLSEQNRERSARELTDILTSLRVVRGKPLLVQIGPFTASDDPVGVVNAYRLVKKHHDVRLVLAGTGGDEPGRGAIGDEPREGAPQDPHRLLLQLPAAAYSRTNAPPRRAR